MLPTTYPAFGWCAVRSVETPLQPSAYWQGGTSEPPVCRSSSVPTSCAGLGKVSSDGPFRLGDILVSGWSHPRASPQSTDGRPLACFADRSNRRIQRKSEFDFSWCQSFHSARHAAQIRVREAQLPAMVGRPWVPLPLLAGGNA